MRSGYNSFRELLHSHSFSLDSHPSFKILYTQGMQSPLDKDEYFLCHLATGDILRAAVAAGTDVDKKVKAHGGVGIGVGVVVGGGGVGVGVGVGVSVVILVLVVYIPGLLVMHSHAHAA